jgi:DNA-binding response OmpR family regulator
MLSAQGSEDDRITALDEGADDYLPKPFNPRELVSRIRAILRRTQQQVLTEDAEDRASLGLRVDADARRAFYRGKPLALTDVEFSLLHVFLNSPSRVLEREDLVTRVFQRPFNPMDRSLDVHISRLRRKLVTVGEFADPIRAIRSSGYLFTPPA